MRRFTPALLVLFGVFSLLVLNFGRAPLLANAATSSTVNFQARLQSAAGGIVPDGYYNVEFKLYSASSGGSALWTEDYLNSGSQGLKTVNGYLSANLGSLTAFTGINWDQPLWLTMNIGGTVTSGTFPSIGDGEMNPRLSLTAVPYAFSAGEIDKTAAGGRSTLSLQGSASGHGDQNFVIQDQGAAGTYNLLTTNQANANYIQLQSSPDTQQNGSLNISGIAMATTLQAATVDTASSGTLNIGTTNATDISLNQNTTLASGKTLTINGSGFDGSGNLGIGTTSPSRPITMQINNSSVNSLPLLIQQGSTGDTGIELSLPSQSYYVGVDGTDSSFKISSSTATISQSTIGYTGVGDSTDSGDNNHILATKFTATSTGTISSLYTHIASPVGSGSNNKGQMAVYADNSGSPGTLLASSGDVTLTGGAWNLFSISPVNVTNGQTYWLAYNNNGATSGDNNVNYHSGSTSQSKVLVQTYGTWPGTWSGGNDSSAEIAYYGIIDITSGTDNFNTSLFRLGQTGQATFQNSSNSSSGFQVQNASGVGVFTIDTSTGTATTNALQAGSLDTASAGTLSIGTGNATTINIGTNNSGHTINVGTGTGTQAVTVGSTSGSSSLLLQGGSGGIFLNSSTTFGFKINGTPVFSLDSNGKAVFKATSNSSDVFLIQNADGSKNEFSVDTSANLVHISNVQIESGGNLDLVQGDVIADNGYLTLNGTRQVSFHTPKGSDVLTKINIPIFNPGDFGQIVAMGLPSGASDSARVLSLFDARAGDHQPTISVFDPTEANVFGLTWEGSNSITNPTGNATLKSTSNGINIRVGGVSAVSIANSSGSSILQVGVLNSSTGSLALARDDSGSTVSIQAASGTGNYILQLPVDTGTTGQCMVLASASSSVETLGYTDCLTTGTGVQLQTGTPSAQTGNLSITGSGTFGGGVAVKTVSNSALLIQDASNNTLFNADTSGMVIKVSGTTDTFATLQIDNAHFKSTQSNAPAIGTPTNCASTPSAAITSGSTDAAGSFTVTVGSGGSQATCDTVVTFNQAYGTAPKAVMLSPTKAVGSATQVLPAQVNATSSTTFTVQISPTTAADGGVYSYYYWVIE